MLLIKNLRVHDLAEALEFRFVDDESFFWLHPATGAISLWSESVADEAESEGWDVDDIGGVRIDPIESSESFRDMEEFIETLQDAQISSRLVRALEHSKPFRNFKDELNRHPGLTEHWYEFHDTAMHARAIRWLARTGLVEDADAGQALTQLYADTE